MVEFFNENHAAWWGAGISTVLLFKEIYSWKKYLPDYDILFFITGEPGADDRIIIHNKSNRITNIIGVQLYTASSRTSNDRKNKDIGQNGEYRLITVQPHQNYVINLSDQDKFRVKNGQKLYIEIYHIGKKTPFVKEVK